MVVLKKKFFDVELEILESRIQLYAARLEDLDKRVIKYDLTKILKGKNCEAKFMLRKEGDIVIGHMFSFVLYPSYIRKLIGHGISMVEDSFVIKAQDCNMRIKPFLITRKKVHRSVRKALRDECKKLLEKYVEENDSKKIFDSILSATLQRTLSKKLKKIYPLGVCEIRVAEIVK